jgi:hypothetical protein
MEKRKTDPDSSNKMSDWVKKALLTGVGAVFMTEEGIKNALSDLKMPKNAVLAAVAQADKAKQEVASLIAKEVRGFLDRIAVEDIIQKALAGQSVEITATIRFVDDKKVQKKAVKMTAKIKNDET